MSWRPSSNSPAAFTCSGDGSALAADASATTAITKRHIIIANLATVHVIVDVASRALGRVRLALRFGRARSQPIAGRLDRFRRDFDLGSRGSDVGTSGARLWR